ncbi:hypothetical protein T265_15667, partial [Opisthorchis viverrini]
QASDVHSGVKILRYEPTTYNYYQSCTVRIRKLRVKKSWSRFFYRGLFMGYIGSPLMEQNDRVKSLPHAPHSTGLRTAGLNQDMLNHSNSTRPSPIVRLS